MKSLHLDCVSLVFAAASLPLCTRSLNWELNVERYGHDDEL